MITLNQATSMTKVAGRWLAIITGALIAVFLLLKIGGFIKNIIAPTPPPPPTVSYGKLPEIKFPVSIDGKNNSYTIDTVTGMLPQFSDRAKVFKILQKSPDLLALQKASKNVAQAEFTQGPVRIQNNLYQWSDPISQTGRKIRLDIFTSEFNLTSSYFSDPIVQSGNNFPNKDKAIGLAQNFLSSILLFPEDIDIQNAKTSFYSIADSTLVPVENTSNARIVEVDLSQKKMDDLPIHYPNPSGSNIKILIGGGQNQPQVVEASFFHQEISKDSSTYPIKTGEQAYSELKDGRAYVASPGKNDVLIQDISLGYYMSDKKQDYLMPIVVFKGNNGFVAYLPAVTDEWIEK